MKTWNDTRGTLDGYQWTGTGKDARVLDWDFRGNLHTQTKDGYSATYYYDRLNRLTYANEGWPVEVNTKDSPDAFYGTRERDVAGRRALDFTSGVASVKFDYHATSVGLNLGNEHAVNKLRLNRAGSRVSERTLEVYVSSDGMDDSWTKVTGTTQVSDQEGVTIQFERPVSTQYVKVHSTWDERDAENRAIDNSAMAGTPAQLIEVWFTSNGQTTSWTYDGMGNRITEGRYNGYSSSLTHEYYANSNLLKAKGSWRFNYDANGNLTSRGTNGVWNGASYDWDSVSGELWTYAYDLKNRLIEVRHGKAGAASLKTVATYAYDIRDLRVVTTKTSETTYYQYDQSGDLLWTESGAKHTAYVQVLGQIWAEVRTTGGVSEVYWHSTDHLGSTELVTDASGTVVWSGSYEAFGKVSRSNGNIAFTPSYTGEILDVDTELYYYNARFYSAELGRFITMDPARDGDNWVAYVSNNPLARIDPTGLGDIANLAKAEQQQIQRVDPTGLEANTAAKPPYPVASGKITTVPGVWTTTSGAIRTHQGVDYGVPEGTPVASGFDGKVTKVYSDPKKGYGYGVQITSADGYVQELGHFASLPVVVKGQAVTAGLNVGATGNTGDSSGPHLHESIIKDGVIVDPNSLRDRSASYPVDSRYVVERQDGTLANVVRPTQPKLLASGFSADPKER